MKVLDIQRKLLRNGYIFNVCMQTGAYTAKREQTSYSAKTFNALNNNHISNFYANILGQIKE